MVLAKRAHGWITVHEHVSAPLGVPKARTKSKSSEARVDGLGFQSKYAENTFVDTAQRLLANKAL